MKQIRLRILFLALIMMLGVLTILSAISFSAEGYGNTAEAARFDAQVNLASRFSSRVVSSQRLVISETSDGKKSNSNQVFAQDASVHVSLQLLGVKFDNAHFDSGGSYVVTAYLDDSALPQYLTRLETIKRSIEELEERNTAAVDDQQQKTNLILLLEYYDDFEAYATIARALDQSAVIPELTRTKAGVELDYWGLLDRVERELEVQRTLLEQDMGNVALRLQASQRLSEIQLQLDATRAEREAWQAEQQGRQAIALRQADETIRRQALLMQQRAETELAKVVSRHMSIDSRELIEQIEGKKRSYKTIEDDLDAQILQRRTELLDEYERKIDALQNEPFRKGELVGNVPTENALNFRQQRIQGLIDERDRMIEEASEQLRRSVSSQLDTLRQAILKESRQLEETSYTIEIASDTVAVKVGEYDGFRSSWPVALRFNLVETPFSLDFYIPYESITQKKLPNLIPTNEGEYQRYNEYLDQVDLFGAFFSSLKYPLTGTLTYRIFIGETFSTYTIAIESYTLRRSDTGSTIISERYKSAPYLQAREFRSEPVVAINPAYQSLYTKELQKYDEKTKKEQARSLKKSKYQAILKSEETNPLVIGSSPITPTISLTLSKPVSFVYEYNVHARFRSSQQLRFGAAAHIGMSSIEGMSHLKTGSFMGTMVSAEWVCLLSVQDAADPRDTPDTWWLFVRPRGGVSVTFTENSPYEVQGVFEVGVGIRKMWGHVLVEVPISYQFAGPSAHQFSIGVGLGFGGADFKEIWSFKY